MTRAGFENIYDNAEQVLSDFEACYDKYGCSFGTTNTDGGASSGSGSSGGGSGGSGGSSSGWTCDGKPVSRDTPMVTGPEVSK